MTHVSSSWNPATFGARFVIGAVHTERMRNTAELATRASALLLSAAAGCPDADAAYRTLLYPVIFAIARRKGGMLATSASRTLGTDGLPVPAVPAADRDIIAHDVATMALDRALAAAGRFDPERGDGVAWAIRQANFCHVDVTRSTYGTRRAIAIVPTDDEHLILLADADRQHADPADTVAQREAVRTALAALPYEQRAVTLLILHYGFSYAEAAAILFSDSKETAKVDRLLSTARRALAAAQALWEAGADTRPASEG